MKNKAKKIAALCAAVACGALVLAGCNDHDVEIKFGKYRYDDAARYLVGNGEYAANTVNELSVEWIAGEVILREGEGDKITFTETTAESDSDFLMHYSLEGGDLKIRFQKSGTKVMDSVSKTLVVEFPRGFRFHEVEIDTASADISVSGIACTELDVDTASGGVKIDCASVREAQVDTASGDVFFYGSFDNLDCDTASGDVYLTFPEGKGFRVSFESVSGIVNNSTAADYSGKIYVYGNGQAFAEVDTKSGNLFLLTGYEE